MSSYNEIYIPYEYDFLLFGIVSSAKDYKLAWSMNQELQLRLVKAPDLLLDLHKDRSIMISNFIFKTSHCTFRLLKNKSYDSTGETSGYLLPDYQQTDYLLMIQDATETVRSQEVSARLQKIADIDSETLLDVNTLLYKENLIF